MRLLPFRRTEKRDTKEYERLIVRMFSDDEPSTNKKYLKEVRCVARSGASAVGSRSGMIWKLKLPRACLRFCLRPRVLCRGNVLWIWRVVVYLFQQIDLAFSFAFVVKWIINCQSIQRPILEFSVVPVGSSANQQFRTGMCRTALAFLLASLCVSYR